MYSGLRMVKTGHSINLSRLPYRADDENGGVETLTFADLRNMPVGRTEAPIQRADFHVIAIVESGRGRVSVDFVEHRFSDREVIWIRPGRVHCWNDIKALRGTIVLFRQDSAPSHFVAVDSYGPASWRPTSSWPLVCAAISHLRSEHDLSASTPLSARREILQALLQVLILRIAEGAPLQSARRQVFTAYVEAVDTHCTNTRQVTWYARHLGYSQRTLSRATLEVCGRTAKQFVDDRLVLEAKRLLVHSGLTVAECATRTGFDDSSNFSKFFRARTGRTPGEFAVTGKA
jgi:AraC-like DNA-binding protein